MGVTLPPWILAVKISQSLTALEWVPRGRFVGKQEVIVRIGSGITVSEQCGEVYTWGATVAGKVN